MSASAGTAALATDVPIVLYVDTAELGGAAAHARDLVSGFSRRGYRVAALCHRTDELRPFREELAELGIDVHAVEGWDLSVLGRIRRVLSIASVIRRYPGCLLLEMIGNFRSGGPVTLAGVLGGARAIVRADMQPPMPPIRRRYRLSLWVKDRFTRRFIVNAEQSRDSFATDMGRDARKIDVVHQGIDLDRLVPGVGREVARAQLGCSGDAIVVGAISRLGGDVWRKGIDRFIDAAAIVGQRHPEARFVVVGDGGALPALKQQAASLGIADRINWTGWRADVPALIAAMDIFVMPSLYEGTPTILLEAMAMAKSVVATRVGVVPEVVADGVNGCVVEPGDAEALADAMAGLIARPATRAALGQAARSTATRSFSRELMVDGYLACFGLACGAGRPRQSSDRQAGGAETGGSGAGQPFLDESPTGDQRSVPSVGAGGRTG